MKKVTLKSVLAYYKKQMETLVTPLIKQANNELTLKIAYDETIKTDTKEIKEYFNDYKMGIYPEEIVIDFVVERIQYNVHWFNARLRQIKKEVK